MRGRYRNCGGRCVARRGHADDGFGIVAGGGDDCEAEAGEQARRPTASEPDAPPAKPCAAYDRTVDETAVDRFRLAATAEALLLATNSLIPYALSARELGRRKDVEARVGRVADLLLFGLCRGRPRPE